MPKRKDIKSILVIGAGPIVIGQACEFDYSGSQACKALWEDGFRVILINSNPATIMTDPDMADKTYIEPVDPFFVEKIIEKERPDAILPTLGGQTALNTAVALAESGVLEKYGVEMIGANLESIQKAEDRSLFKKAMQEIGAPLPKSGFAYNVEEAMGFVDTIGLPAIIRPSFTMGGTGGGIAYNIDEYKKIAANGIELSPTNEILVEESIIGWKEFELEVMRDTVDNVVIICSIENFDPMGIHTGDSITVAPAQTLSNREYQELRDWSLKIIRKIGVDTGGSNIQFAKSPKTGQLSVIEMNPRVSRSSALASKATGFPIAKIAAKLAVGYSLDEIPNDITQKTPASFEPTLDYVVTKIPRFAFEKFPNTEPQLNIQMKSVGETMGIGRTFKESFQKAIRGLETGRAGFISRIKKRFPGDIAPELNLKAETERILKNGYYNRLFGIYDAFDLGFSIDKIIELTGIDVWFLSQLKEIYDMEKEIIGLDILADRELFFKIKATGFSDKRISFLKGVDEGTVFKARQKMGLKPVYKLVDTCAAEFEALTPYYYSTYEEENEAVRSNKKKIMIIGGGPNRIGQGIEFDYCCVHAANAVNEQGYESIMVNSNPETVSTDYDTSDKLYFEPVTFEDIINVYENEQPDGVIVQMGGQTPLSLANRLEAAGVKIIGTTPDCIDRAEDRERFQKLLNDLGYLQPANGLATSEEDALKITDRIGFPVVVRPSYVLGGRAMQIVHTKESLSKYLKNAIDASSKHPILIDSFLVNATEIDVDAVCDGETVEIAAIMEHIEEAGIHSGDSACVLPSVNLTDEILQEITRQTKGVALELGVIGLLNIQFAVQGEVLYFIEVNPRASRTVPFVSKATGIQWAKIATKVMMGAKLSEMTIERLESNYISVKEAVLPFNKFPMEDTILSPEMKSTGEVMGIASDFGSAYAKAQWGALSPLPAKGTVFVSVAGDDKAKIVGSVKLLVAEGFKVMATSGTKRFFDDNGINSELVYKVNEARPHVVDFIKSKKIDLIFNTPANEESFYDDKAIRKAAIVHGVPCITTVSGINASAKGIVVLKSKPHSVKSLQEFYEKA